MSSHAGREHLSPPCRPMSTAPSRRPSQSSNASSTAAAYDLDLSPRVTFTAHTGARGAPFVVPDRLWRLDPVDALATITLPQRLHWSGPSRPVRLRDRGDRARVYEIVLREGDSADLLTYVDGALLVDQWTNWSSPPRSVGPGSRSSPPTARPHEQVGSQRVTDRAGQPLLLPPRVCRIPPRWWRCAHRAGDCAPPHRGPRLLHRRPSRQSRSR